VRTALLNTPRARSLFVGAFCLLFFFRGVVNTWYNLAPDGDQESFLDLALNVREGRGFVASGPCPMMLDAGVYPPEAGRQPLYPFFLALIARRSPLFFTEAKLMTLLLGVLLVAAFWRTALRVAPPHTALLATSLLASNIGLQVYSVKIMAEAPLTLFFGLGCLLVWEGFGRPVAWKWAGLAAGLAYMSKGTAMFLPIAFFCAALIGQGFHVARRRHFWLFGAAFLLGASPLLVRNATVFGNPFYNYNSAHVFWLDRWNAFWTPFVPNALPSMASYFESHALTDALWRLANGMRDMARILPTSMRTMQSVFLPSRALRVAPYLLFAFVVWDVLRPHNRGRQAFVAVLTLVFLVAFSWYIFVAFSMRFLLPVVPLYCLCASRTIVELIGWASRSFGAGRAGLAKAGTQWLCALLWCVMLIGTVSDAQRVSWTHPLRAFNTTEDRLKLAAWIVQNVPREAVLCYGPEQHLWLWLDGRYTIFLPTVDDTSRTRRYLRQFGVSYLIIDSPSIHRRPWLQRYFNAGPNGVLRRFDRERWSADFPRWPLVFQDGPQPRFVVFRAEQKTKRAQPSPRP